MKKYKLQTELTLKNIEALKHTLSRSNHNYLLFLELLDIVEKEDRNIVTIGNKKYYEDELQKALENIKPLNQ